MARTVSILLIVCVCTVVTNGSQCPTFQCAQSSGQVPEGSCAAYDKSENAVYMNSTCPGKQICPATKLPAAGHVSCEDPPTNAGTALIHEECTEDADCYTSKHASAQCVFGACMGYQKYGDACADSRDCQDNLYCSNGSCQYQQMPGYSCSSTEECELSCSCVQGKCQTYYTGAAGSPCNAHDECESMFCQSNKVCSKGTPMTNGTQFQGCSSDSDCASRSFTGGDGKPRVENQTCACGYNPSRAKYCNIFPGDMSGKMFADQDKKWKQGKRQHCNTTHREDPRCFRIDNGILDWKGYYFNKFMNTPEGSVYIGSDDCGNKWLIPEWVASILYIGIPPIPPDYEVPNDNGSKSHEARS